MPQLSSGHVFISYSRKDDVVMRRIVAFLRRQKIKVWVDNEKLIPGTPIWEEEIEKAIKAAFAIVVVLSPDSKNSEWVRREISLADQYRKRVFPVLVSGDEESSISLRLINRQFVNIRENENAGLRSLANALSTYMQELIEQEEKTKQLTIQKITEETKSEKEESKNEYLANKKSAGEQTTGSESSKFETDNTNATRVNNQNILWATLGWAISGLIGAIIYNSVYDNLTGRAIGGAFGGAFGGFFTAMTLRRQNIPSIQRSLYQTIMAWGIAGAIGWTFGEALTEAIGAGIGMAFFAVLGLASTLGEDYIRSNWKKVARITLAWAISAAMGWSISKGMIDGLYLDPAMSWAIGTMVSWAIGGFVMVWQLLKR